MPLSIHSAFDDCSSSRRTWTQQAHDQAAAQSNIIESAQRMQADALVRARTALAELRELLLEHQR